MSLLRKDLFTRWIQGWNKRISKLLDTKTFNFGIVVGAADGASEYDRLLAMHLAQDLGHQDEDLDDIVRNFDKPSSLSVQNQYGTNGFPNGKIKIYEYIKLKIAYLRTKVRAIFWIFHE